MKNFWAKIWIPALLVTAAAMQSFGIDVRRAAIYGQAPDSLAHIPSADSSTITLPADTLHQSDSVIQMTDSLRTATDSLQTHPDSLRTQADSLLFSKTDTLILTARDTIKAPDSLRLTDPFFYKYYVAVKDSTTRRQVRDSLMQAGDTLGLYRLDSLYIKDSTDIAIAKHNAWYASLSRRERKKYDNEQKLPELLAAYNRKMAIKDSIKAYKDSVIENTPRILETFAFPDSMHYKRIVTWTHDRDFHDIVGLRDQAPDSSFNNNFHEYPFYKKDVNATWLGVAGSPVQLYDYFKREEEDNAIFYAPYQIYSYTPETLPQYNTKTTYTELDYYGTLFANKEKEESNIKILTTQNITPELNIMLQYHRFGSNGMLKGEDVNNRNSVIAANYTGKKYMMHTGFIHNRVKKTENGGIMDLSWIRDTTVDAREVGVYLNDAHNDIKKSTIFLDQSYRIPLTFLDKDIRAEKKLREQEDMKLDSLIAAGDTAAVEQFKMSIEERRTRQEESKVDTLKTEITTAFIGHSSEYTVTRKSYKDNISANDTEARKYFGDRFYLNPTTSNDSLRVMKFDNKVFIRLQPWTSDAIVSKIDVGLGDKLLNYFTFNPKDYVTGRSNVVQNSVYLYAGAQGQYKKYLTWNAKGRYTFLGHEINDFRIEGNASLSAYPFRRDRKSPLTLNVHFETSLKEPDYYQQHLYTNHYMWNNDFGKISTTKLEASLDIPRWKMSASFGYGLLSNNIYYDTSGIVRQNSSPMSVISATLRKDFKVWKFHFENQAALQFSSNSEVMPLPLLALNLRYYFQFDVVKNVMKMQIGAHALYTTKWYAPGYNPVLGVFHNQTEEKFGGCPYIDAFVNIQWKRASIFVKAVNVNMGWPNKKADYFTAAGYITSQRAIKFGITWPFYVFSHKNASTSAGGSQRSGSGSGRSTPRGAAMQNRR
jgi:hypothetical protein